MWEKWWVGINACVCTYDWVGREEASFPSVWPPNGLCCYLKICNISPFHLNNQFTTTTCPNPYYFLDRFFFLPIYCIRLNWLLGIQPLNDKTKFNNNCIDIQLLYRSFNGAFCIIKLHLVKQTLQECYITFTSMF